MEGNKNLTNDPQSQKSEFKEELENLKEEKENYEDDLDEIPDAVKAASKLSLGQTPSIEENQSLSSLKDNYSAFFESDSEQGDSISLLTKVMSVKQYIQSEINTTKASINELIKSQTSTEQEERETKQDSLEREIEARVAISKAIIETGEYPSKAKSMDTNESSSESKPIEVAESSSKAIANIKVGEFSTAAKRKAEDNDIEESSLKKSRQSPSDFIDELPYNPFDDVGSD